MDEVLEGSGFGDICFRKDMTPEQLVDHLEELSRQDVAILFPKDDQFLLGMDVFKYIEKLRAALSTSPKPTTLTKNRAGSSGPKLSEDGASTSSKTEQRKRPRSNLPFTLPVFEPDLEQAIEKDAFFNPHKRAKLIRKACCREQDIAPSKELREDLAKTLVQLAPRSLSDPTTGKRGQPSAHEGLLTQINKWFYNNSFQARMATGNVKKRKKTESGEENEDESNIAQTEDDESLEKHCKEVENECKKKKPDYSKCFRMLSLTISHRKKWLVTLTPANRVALNIGRFSCLKDPDMLYNEFLKRSSGRVLNRKEQAQEQILESVKKFTTLTIPAVIEMAKNSGCGSPKSSGNGEKLIFALQYAMIQLKCCKKDKVQEAMKEVLVINEEPCAAELSKAITSPFLCVEGQTEKVRQMSVIGKKKVICTLQKNSSLCQGLLALICCYYLYQFEYPKNPHQLYVFLADKLGGAPLERKPTTAYKISSEVWRCLKIWHWVMISQKRVTVVMMSSLEWQRH